MRKIMVFQHVAHEPLGVLDHMLRRAGFRIKFVNFARQPDFVPNLDNYNGLIILGGPMGVYDGSKYPNLLVEMRLIEEALKRDIPVLGICLGAQLIAATLGASVHKAKDWELGWSDIQITDRGKIDPLFQGFEKSETIFQLHQDTFNVPDSAEHLAQSGAVESQAFRYANKVYGLQFHLESDQKVIERWIKMPEHQKLLKHIYGSDFENKLSIDTQKSLERSLYLAEKVFGKFIELFNLPERPRVLTSTHKSDETE